MKYLSSGKQKYLSDSKTSPQFPDISAGLWGCMFPFLSNYGDKFQEGIALSQHSNPTKWVLPAGFGGHTAPPVVLSLYVIFKLLYIPQWNTLRPQPPPLWSNLLGFFNHTLFFKGAEIVRLFLIKFGSWIFSLWRRCPGVVDPDPAGRVSGSAGSGLGHPFSKHSSREWHWSNLVWQKCLKHIDLSYFPYL